MTYFFLFIIAIPIILYIRSQIKTSKQTGASPRNKIGLAILVFIILIVVISALSNTTHAPGVGENARLYNQEGKDLYVAVTEGAYKVERKSIMAGDRQGLINLMSAGQLFTVPNETPVLIIDRGQYKRKIRITSGKYINLSGWVPDEYVKEN